VHGDEFRGVNSSVGVMDGDGTQVWCHVVVLSPQGLVLAAGDLEGRGAPDMRAVERLARVALAVRRAGGVLAVRDASAALQELVDLAGLRRQVFGQVEDGEQALGVEKGVQADDPPL
jgi:hypothetical protein